MRALYKELVHYVRNHTNIPDQGKYLVAPAQESHSPNDPGVFNEYLLKRQLSLDYWLRLFWTNSRNWDTSAILNTRYSLDNIPPSEDPTIPYHLPALLYHQNRGDTCGHPFQRLSA
jgi:hypothetical protein